MVLTELEIEGWTGAAVLAAKSGGGGVERRRSGDQIDAGANGGRGSESGGEPGPKTKLRRRISVAGVRRGFGTTAAQGVQGLGAAELCERAELGLRAAAAGRDGGVGWLKGGRAGIAAG